MELSPNLTLYITSTFKICISFRTSKLITGIAAREFSIFCVFWTLFAQYSWNLLNNTVEWFMHFLIWISCLFSLCINWNLLLQRQNLESTEIRDLFCVICRDSWTEMSLSIWYHMLIYGMLCYDMIWYDMIRYVMLWYDMICYDMV